MPLLYPPDDGDDDVIAALIESTKAPPRPVRAGLSYKGKRIYRNREGEQGEWRTEKNKVGSRRRRRRGARGEEDTPIFHVLLEVCLADELDNGSHVRHPHVTLMLTTDYII